MLLIMLSHIVMVVTMARRLLRKSFSITESIYHVDAHIMNRYFLEQNAGIANGTVEGITIPLKFLGVGDGITVSSLEL